jgi:cell division protein FtsQ
VQSVTVDELETTAAAPRANAGFLHGVVLPRVLRRPVRVLSKFDWRMPRQFGLKGLISMFLATAVAGIVIGGHELTFVSALTAWSGLAIDEVKITGQSETSEVDVLDGLKIGSYPSLLTFDVEAAKARVEKLPWVKEATLKKLYPHGLEVAITERQPFAVWQYGGTVSLVDETGKVITDQVPQRYAALPLVVGEGAAARAGEFINMVSAFPDIAERVHAGVLISGRRWTIVLEDGVELMLPQKDPMAALQTIAALDASDQLLSREIAAVDLRTGEVVIRLDQKGLAARKAMLKQRAKRKRSNT